MFDWLHITLPHVRDLGISYALAFLIGWEREQADRSAGLRTFPLVAIASCAFIQASEGVLDTAESKGTLLQGLITGIGFIGGGAILQKGSSVKGTATAASLWATGAIGVAVGLGSYGAAVVVTLFTVGTLWFSKPLKRGENDDDKGDGDGNEGEGNKDAKQVHREVADRGGL